MGRKIVTLDNLKYFYEKLQNEKVDIVDALNQSIDNKQDTIDDLEIIRQGAAKGATALQSHQDISGKLDKTEAALTYVPLSGGSLYNNASLTFSLYDTRTLTITGNSIDVDMSRDTGGWAGTFASIKDPLNDVTTMLGWYGGTGGLTHIFMGGSYSDPAMKMEKNGQFTFKYSPKVLDKTIATVEELATVATSGSYNDLSNKPTIPSAVTESTVSGWGFTKNTGTITEIKMNGVSKGSSGVVDLGTVITAHQDISGKQDKLVSGTNIKTINNTSLLGSGNIAIGASYPYVDYGTSNGTATLNPNTYYKWDVVSSLTITRGPEIPGVVNEYFFEFCSGATPTTLTFTQGINFLGGEPPVIGTYRRIQISIIRGNAVVLDFELVD